MQGIVTPKASRLRGEISDVGGKADLLDDLNIRREEGRKMLANAGGQKRPRPVEKRL